MERKIMETTVTTAESKKRLLLNVEKSNFSTSTTTGTNTPGSSEYFFTDSDLDSKSPPHKQRVKTRPDISVNSCEGIATMPDKSSIQCKSPLDLLIEDKQVELEKEREKVNGLQRELERLSAVYGKHPGVDFSRLACTNCHRREGHNRVNCPYKGHPCLSSKFCGDLNKHKDEKDAVSAAAQNLFYLQFIVILRSVVNSKNTSLSARISVLNHSF